MNLIIRRSFIVSLLFASIMTLHIAHGQSNFQYMYAIAMPDDLQLWAVDGEQARLVQTLAIADVLYANASPDGEWIAFISGTRDLRIQVVWLWNVRSQQLREVTQGGIYYSFTLNEHSLRWSPDSRYLGIAAGGELLIHDTTDATTSNITHNAHVLYLAWSPNSVQVATAAWQYIGTEQGAYASLQAFDVSTGEMTVAFDLTEDPYLYGAPVCDLNWSPDDRFVSFRSYCDVPDVASPREVYVWDTRENTLQAVTRRTLDAFLANPGSIIKGEYDHVWQDAERLIVGADTFTEHGGQVSQTLLYNPTTQTSQIISPTAFMRLTANPVSKALAFQVANLVLERDPNSQEPIRIITTDDLAREGSDSILAVSHIIDTPGGCDLQWSPDGRTLAYTVRTGGTCQAAVESIILVDDETTAVQQFAVSQDDVGHSIPIGWVAG